MFTSLSHFRVLRKSKSPVEKSQNVDIEMGLSVNSHNEDSDIHYRTMVQYFRKEIQALRMAKVSEEAIKRRLRRESVKTSMTEDERREIVEALKEALQ